MPKKEIKKVLFYTHTPRFFRSILIGHLFEIAQGWPTVLLSEELDKELNNRLADKKYFPKLEEIVPIRQFTGPKENIFQKNWKICRQMKEVVLKYKPNIVVAASDMHSLGEMYLMRFAKKAGAKNIVFQAGNAIDSKSLSKSIDLINAYLRFPSFLPLFFRLFFTRCRKYIGHFFYYYILPILAGQKPFFGKSSYILRHGNAGMRDADYSVVFSEREFKIFKEDGVPEKKLLILTPLLKREKKQKKEPNQKIATLLLPSEEIGFRKKDESLITKEERLSKRLEIIKLVSEKLTGWKIFIKPHPNVKNFKEIKNLFESISNFIEVTEPSEPSEDYVAKSQVVIGLPKSNTTVLFSTSLAFPEKIIISLDFDKEFLGDFYKDFQGIEYIDDENKFGDLLEVINSGKYQKEEPENKKETSRDEFRSAVELINNINKQ